MESYIYNPMDPKLPVFRLMRLLNGISSDPIRCDVFDMPLHEIRGGVTYEALSYVWGSNETNEIIEIGGKSKGITRNLYDALHHLRHNDEDRILWVDAICIDQSNDMERNHQVKHMGDIYKEADKVIIWLGLFADDSDLLFEWMEKLSDETRLIFSSGSEWKSLIQFWMDFRPDFWPGMLTKMRAQRAFESLLKRPWFRRIWILQEVANSRDAVVACGTHTVSARVFALMPSVLAISVDQHIQAVLDLMPGLSREDSWWSQKRDLFTLLSKFNNSEASDKRDMVYALLAMSSDAHNTDFFRADYTISLQQTLKNALVYFLHYSYGLSLTNTEIPLQTWEDFCGHLNSLKKLALNLVEEMYDFDLMQKLLKPTRLVLNQEKDHDATLASAATAHPEEDLLREILAQLKDVNIRGDDLGWTPLIYLVVHGSIDNIMILLRSPNIDVNLACHTGKTPLAYAAELDRYAAVRNLVDHPRINLIARASCGSTPLIFAARQGHEDIVGVLVTYLSKRQFECEDNRTRTAFQWAVVGKHPGVLLRLIASRFISDEEFQKADVSNEWAEVAIDVTAPVATQALRAAMRTQSSKIIDWLWDKRVPDLLESSSLEKILEEASLQGCSYFIKKFTEREFRARVWQSRLETMLINAAENGHHETFEELLNLGEKRYMMYSVIAALKKAGEKDHWEIVKILLNRHHVWDTKDQIFDAASFFVKDADSVRSRDLLQAREAFRMRGQARGLARKRHPADQIARHG